jgi:hypothetical protein
MVGYLDWLGNRHADEAHARYVAQSKLRMMDRDQILKAAQRELEQHDFSTFTQYVPASEHGVTVPGCPRCGLRLQTIAQFVRHLADDVLPNIVDMAVRGGRVPGIDDEDDLPF